MCFINLSNHTSAQWSAEQKSEAEKYGRIIDIPFPAVDANGSEEYIAELAEQYDREIVQYEHPTIMLQGEFTFTFALATMLKRQGYTVLAACSERRAIEFVNAEGHSEKRSEFAFVRFRRY